MPHSLLALAIFMEGCVGGLEFIMVDGHRLIGTGSMDMMFTDND